MVKTGIALELEVLQRKPLLILGRKSLERTLSESGFIVSKAP